MSRTLGDYSPWGLAAPTSPHVKCGHHHRPPDTKGPLETAHLEGHGDADQLGRGKISKIEGRVAFRYPGHKGT